MRVVIAGGHGQIALLLEESLARGGDEPVGIVRNPAHVPDLEAVGARAVVLDLEEATVDDVAATLAGADAVVFAAGGGPGSGAARKETVDRGAAILLADQGLILGKLVFLHLAHESFTLCARSTASGRRAAPYNPRSARCARS